MKSAKPRAACPRARRRSASRIAGSAGGAVEGFIYNRERMDTLASMFKRILVLLGAALLGFAACLGAIRLAGAWSLFPNRDLDRSSAYVREVLKIVNENRSEEHTSELQSLRHLVCRLLLEKK